MTDNWYELFEQQKKFRNERKMPAVTFLKHLGLPIELATTLNVSAIVPSRRRGGIGSQLRLALEELVSCDFRVSFEPDLPLDTYERLVEVETLHENQMLKWGVTSLGIDAQQRVHICTNGPVDQSVVLSRLQTLDYQLFSNEVHFEAFPDAPVLT